MDASGYGYELDAYDDASTDETLARLRKPLCASRTCRCKLAEKLTNTKIPDLNSGLRAFRRQVALPYLRLLSPGFSCVTTITIAFLSNQHDVRPDHRLARAARRPDRPVTGRHLGHPGQLAAKFVMLRAKLVTALRLFVTHRCPQPSAPDTVLL